MMNYIFSTIRPLANDSYMIFCRFYTDINISVKTINNNKEKSILICSIIKSYRRKNNNLHRYTIIIIFVSL